MGATAISRAPSDAAVVAEEIRRLSGKRAEGKTDLQFLPDWITLELPDGPAKEMASRLTSPPRSPSAPDFSPRTTPHGGGRGTHSP